MVILILINYGKSKTTPSRRRHAAIEFVNESIVFLFVTKKNYRDVFLNRVYSVTLCFVFVRFLVWLSKNRVKQLNNIVFYIYARAIVFFPLVFRTTNSPKTTLLFYRLHVCEPFGSVWIVPTQNRRLPIKNGAQSVWSLESDDRRRRRWRQKRCRKASKIENQKDQRLSSVPPGTRHVADTLFLILFL